MEVDTCCVFANLGNCGGLQTSCHSLCKPPITTEDNSFLLGSNSKIEYLLLKYGKYDMPPWNVEKYHVCANHSCLVPAAQYKHCCLCKSFGRSKSSASGLRIITKQYAFAAWKSNDVELSFGRKMCAQCRMELSKCFSKEDFIHEFDVLFQWLYDVNIVHTPSTASTYSHNTLSQSFQGLSVEEEHKNLKQFLHDVNYFDEVPTTTSFEKLHPSSKKRFCRQSNKVLKRVLHIMAPNDDNEVVWEACTESSRRKCQYNIGLDNNLHVVMNNLAEAYENASHWTIHRQILSIMARDLPFSVINNYISGLTLYRFYMARRHATFEGTGAVVDDARTPTIRYDDYQLEHFIEFIVSPHICTDLPFGEKELRLSTGETLLIPLTIRNLAPQRIITQYYTYCKEYYGNTFRPLGQSTLFSILNKCVASTRQSLQGLDSFSADGSTAFDVLGSIVDSLLPLGLPTTDASEVKRDLQNSRNYLKTDYKVHVSRENSVPDHCSVFALSDPADKCWRKKCQHEHVQQCDRCEILKRTLTKIPMLIEQHQQDPAVRDRLLFRVRQQVKCIEDWKAHQLRTVHQDQARIDVLKSLDSESVMIHVDWAMKWLPVKYRESTKDHFAKRGMSWHIAYVIGKTSTTSQNLPNSLFDVDIDTDDQVYQHKVFCHVFDQCVQNAKTVTSILRHIFLRLRETTPEIKYVHLRSDNAGCYHGAEALLNIEQLFKGTGVWIKTIDFSDPQGGKGPCDRLAAIIKCYIRRFINEKNNCTNSIEFLAASERTKGVEFHACELPNIHTEKVEWKGVKQFNNIKYQQRDTAVNKQSSNEIRVWKSYNVGTGKIYRWSDLDNAVKTISSLKIILSTNTHVSWITDLQEEGEYASEWNESESNDKEDNSDESASDNEQESDHQAFDCPIDGCINCYISYSNLLRHIMSGKHRMKLEKYSLIDKSKMLFHQNLMKNHTRSTPLLSITVVPASSLSFTSLLGEGWASQKIKANIRFNDKQKSFLQEKFNDGVQSGMKWDPAKVAQDMETLTNNGNYVFENEECLTQAQIKSYFSRLTLKQRSKQPISIQQKTASATSSAVTTISTPQMDDSDDNDEEQDDRDLGVYLWRQMVDNARIVLDTPSDSYHTPSETSSTMASSSTLSSNCRTKRKSTDQQAQTSKHKTK